MSVQLYGEPHGEVKMQTVTAEKKNGKQLYTLQKTHPGLPYGYTI
jgi:hypothetical protein